MQIDNPKVAKVGSYIDVPKVGVGYYLPYRIVASNWASEESKAKAHYVCDGTDDQVEIQQAIDDLPSSGGIVFLTEGRFNVSSYIEIVKNHVTLMGTCPQAEGTCIYLTDLSDIHVIIVGDGATKVVGVRIANVCIDGNKANQTATSAGIHLYGASGSEILYPRIENCFIYNCRDWGIVAEYAKRAVIDRCVFVANGAGLEFMSGCEENIVSNNVFIANTAFDVRDNGNENLFLGNKGKVIAKGLDDFVIAYG